MAKLSKMEIFTSFYRFAHGHSPRGRGSWAFRFNLPGSLHRGLFTDEFAPRNLLYSEAKKWATKRADKLGAYSVSVLS